MGAPSESGEERVSIEEMGISEIEGKAARVEASEAGRRVSCVPAFLINLPANGIRFKTG